MSLVSCVCPRFLSRFKSRKEMELELTPSLRFARQSVSAVMRREVVFLPANGMRLDELGTPLLSFLYSSSS